MKPRTKVLLCAGFVCILLALGIALLPSPTPRISGDAVSVRTSPPGCITLLNCTSNRLMAQVIPVDPTSAKPASLDRAIAVTLSPNQAVAVSLGHFTDPTRESYDLRVTASPELRGVEGMIAACKYHLLRPFHKSRILVERTIAIPNSSRSATSGTSAYRYFDHEVLVWKGHVDVAKTPPDKITALP